MPIEFECPEGFTTEPIPPYPQPDNDIEDNCYSCPGYKSGECAGKKKEPQIT